MSIQLRFNFNDDLLEDDTDNNSFFIWCKNNKPDLIDEWDIKKNKNLDYHKLKPFSNKKVWWKCLTCGYEWKTDISHRTKDGRGCPKCAKERTKEKLSNAPLDKSLAFLYPDIISKWDYSKNERGPETYYPKSNKSVWWKCDNCKSEWIERINDRVKSNRGCPVCSNQKIKSGFNDFATLFPDLMKEWDKEKNTVDPSLLFPGGNLYIWWKCERGHHWKSLLYSRTGKIKTGCPYCAKEKRTSFPEKAIAFYLKKIYPDLKENYHPEWLKKSELDIYIPSIQTGIEYDGYHWHKNILKDKNKDDLCFNKGIKLVRIRERECPLYESSSIKIILNEDSSKGMISDSSVKEVLKAINTAYDDIDVRRDEQDILEDYYSILKKKSVYNSSFGKEWNYEKNKGINPEFVSNNSNRYFWWKCVNNHEWKISPSHRTRGHQCPYCSGQKVLSGYNDLASKYPSLIKECDYSKNAKRPEEVHYNSTKKYYWICSQCEHEWSTQVYLRTEMKSGCPKCAASKRGIVQRKCDLENSIVFKFPELLKEWDYSKNKDNPKSVSAYANRKVWWKCKQGHSWEAVVASRTRNNTGCPYCSGRFAFPGVNDLATLFPDLLKEWDYSKNTLDPTKLKASSHNKVWWKCSSCGNEWQTCISVRTGKGKCGCPKCRKKYKVEL